MNSFSISWGDFSDPSTPSRNASRQSVPSRIFVSSDEGIEKLDSICMQLIAIGESVKQLDRLTEGNLLSRYPDVEWKRIAGMRDILSHHYFDIDAEIVYEVCAVHLAPLRASIEQMLVEG